jgi:hypothetical protein
MATPLARLMFFFRVAVFDRWTVAAAREATRLLFVGSCSAGLGVVGGAWLVGACRRTGGAGVSPRRQEPHGFT